MYNKAQLMSVIAELAEEARPELGQDAIDEMAVPSYTQGYFFSRYVFWRKMDWVLRFAAAEPASTILDYGCGTGISLPAWSASAKQVYATDLELTVARKLAAKLKLPNIEFLKPDELDGRVSDGSLDLIVAANVLEHVDDRRALLALLKRKLNPRGRLIVSGPTEGKLYKLGRKIVGFSGHYHVTNVEGVVVDVLASGFRVRKLRRWPLPGPVCLYQIFVFGL
jgi:2-polyprenyl-3-methyl-5-hydroxy-6-metoxy-1,4-benzoquinol methylase